MIHNAAIQGRTLLTLSPHKRYPYVTLIGVSILDRYDCGIKYHIVVDPSVTM